MNTNWRDQIVSTPDVLCGKPRLKGTTIPVSLVLGYLAARKTAQEIIAELPDLNETQITACLDYARDLAEFDGENRPDAWAPVDAIYNRLAASGRTFSDSAELLRDQRSPP
jgi:uncharacterized protein (DUF433 family)